MIFSVWNDGFVWFLGFGPDSIILTFKDFVQEMKFISRKILRQLGACYYLKDKNFLARVLKTPNQDGTMEISDEVLTSVGGQDMDTSGYQVSHLDDIEFYLEND